MFSLPILSSPWPLLAAGLEIDRQQPVPADGLHQRRRSHPILQRCHEWPGRERGTGSSRRPERDRKSTRLNSSHVKISYAVFCLYSHPRSPPFPYTTLFRSKCFPCRSCHHHGPFSQRVLKLTASNQSQLMGSIKEDVAIPFCNDVTNGPDGKGEQGHRGAQSEIGRAHV